MKKITIEQFVFPLALASALKGFHSPSREGCHYKIQGLGLPAGFKKNVDVLIYWPNLVGFLVSWTWQNEQTLLEEHAAYWRAAAKPARHCLLLDLASKAHGDRLSWRACCAAWHLVLKWVSCLILNGQMDLPNGFGWVWFVAKWFWLGVIRCQMVLARCDWVSRNHVMSSQTDLAKEN